MCHSFEWIIVRGRHANNDNINGDAIAIVLLNGFSLFSWVNSCQIGSFFVMWGRRALVFFRKIQFSKQWRKESWSHREKKSYLLLLILIIIVFYRACIEHQASHCAPCKRKRNMQKKRGQRTLTNYLWMHNNSQSHHHRLKFLVSSQLVLWIDLTTSPSLSSISKSVYGSFNISNSSPPFSLFSNI